MDCRHAQEQIDVAFHRSSAEGEELRAAEAHVASCAECQRIVAARRKFDHRLTRAMQEEVDIPRGLRERILLALDDAAEQSASPGVSTPREMREMTGESSPVDVAHGTLPHKGEAGAATPEEWVAAPQPVRRPASRVWRVAAGSLLAATVMIAVGGWGYWQTRELPLSLADVRTALPDPWRSDDVAPVTLPGFDGGFAAAVADPYFQRWVGTAPPGGLNFNGRGGDDAAVYEFRIPGRGGVSGYLLVFAPGRISDAPAMTVPHASSAAYAPQSVAWLQGDQVYLCVVTRGDLQTVLRMYGATA